VFRFALHSLFFLSGAAALGYQLVWAKMFSTGLGHEMPAVLAIIAAFMAGMALGAWGLDRFIPRSTRAGLWLGGLELTIGAWAMLMSFGIPSVNDFALRFIGLDPGAFQHWLIAFTIPALVLLPATAAMGATLPAMEKFLSVLAPQNESVGSVYAANTFGAVAGTLLAPFVLMPALGLSKTCWVLTGLNGVAAFGAIALGRSVDSHVRANSPAAKPKKHKHADSAFRAPFSPRRLALTLFCTGLLGIAYEVAVVRALSQVLEGTVFTYAAVLAVFLLGTAAGAAAFHRWWRGVDPARLLGRLLNGAAVTGLIGIVLLSQTPVIYQSLRALGDAPPAVFAAELLTAVAVFGPATFFMGAAFSHLLEQVRAQRAQVGDVLALNTLGAALAPVLVLLVLPHVGTKWTLYLASFSYFLLAFPHFPRWGEALLGLAALTAAFCNFQFIENPPGTRVISHREGIMATVAVTEDAQTNRTLRVDNRYQMGGTAAADAEYRQSHLPLLLHSEPKRALFLGVGTGISLGAAALHPDLQADAVELVPEVVEAMKFFEAKNFSAQQRTNFKIHVADARRFVRSQNSESRHDVIIADLFHPYRDGAGALYTREHFAAVRQRLATNGLFCQWLPLHQLDEPTLRVIVRTFQSVFPDAEAWLLRFNVEVPVIALMAWAGEPRRSPTQVEPRASTAALGTELKRLALADSLRLFGHLLADADDLSRFAQDAPFNTDDNQRVTFMAPRAAYQHGAKPYASLLALLASSRTEHVSDHRLLPSADSAFAARLARYLAARNVYLRGLVHDAEQRHDDALDAYIESARLSPDFTTGYAQGLSIANILAGSDPARSKRILERLIEAQPERPVARQMLERLFPK
jgi:spermidine synthase